MQNPESDTTAAAPPLMKVPVGVDRLFLGIRIPFDVYLQSGDTYVHLFTKWTHFDEGTRDILRERGISTVFIEGTAAKIEEYLQHTAPAEPESVDTEQFHEYSRKKESYHHIDKTLLVDRTLFVPGTTITFSLYSVDNMVFDLLVEASEVAPVELPRRVFTAKGDLAIRAVDIPLYQDYLNSILHAPEIPETLRRKGRAIAMKENSKILMREVLAAPERHDKMDELNDFIGGMIDSVMGKEISVYDLMSLKSHDVYTYTHSVNVAALSIALAVALGFERSQVEKLALGAVLHDVGKCRIPVDILNKQGELSDREFAVMKTHVVEGVKLLDENRQFPKESLIPVLQHHEKLSGRGYPFKLSGAAVKPFGKIVGIVDCYDYLTTPRPYRYAYTPYMTLNILAKEAKERGDFDPAYLKTFITTLADIAR